MTQEVYNSEVSAMGMKIVDYAMYTLGLIKGGDLKVTECKQNLMKLITIRRALINYSISSEIIDYNRYLEEAHKIWFTLPKNSIYL